MHIFISHIKEEEKIAFKLKEFLQADFLGLVEPFIAADDIKPGEKWLDNIIENLEKAQMLLLMCSPRSITQPWLHFEAGATMIQGKPLIPICYGGLKADKLPPHFGKHQAVTLDNSDDIKKLYDVITENIAKNITPHCKTPLVNYQAISHEFISFISSPKILCLANSNLIEVYQSKIKEKLPAYLILDFADYTELDKILDGDVYKQKYQKIVYYHPHPGTSDPCYIKLVERLTADQAALPLITFSDGLCVDFQVGRRYKETVFANQETTLIQRISEYYAPD
jgi:hypothetical protein